MIARYANTAAGRVQIFITLSLGELGGSEYTAKKILLHYALIATEKPTVARKCESGHMAGAGRNTGMPWTSY